jgi:hypothetical protein
MPRRFCRQLTTACDRLCTVSPASFEKHEWRICSPLNPIASRFDMYQQLVAPISALSETVSGLNCSGPPNAVTIMLLFLGRL